VLALDFTLTCAVFTGRVVDLDGQPVAGAVVSQVRTVPHTWGVLSAVTAGDGSYALAAEFAGDVTVGANKFPRCSASAESTRFVIPGQVIAVPNLPLDCPGRVGGRVNMSDGALPSGVEVVFTPAGSGPTVVAPLVPGGPYGGIGTYGTFSTTLGTGPYGVTVRGLPPLCHAGTQTVVAHQQADLQLEFNVVCYHP
jgi:hypothetical protein